MDRIKNKFDSHSDKMFPLKQKCLDVLYKMVAWVYINTRNLTCLDNEELKTTYLKHHLGIRVATLPRDSDIAWISNPKETLKMFRRYIYLFISNSFFLKRTLLEYLINFLYAYMNRITRVYNFDILFILCYKRHQLFRNINFSYFIFSKFYFI